jgi:Rrf2 family iron-sulfur cluster assembly transcriptional regulator
VRLELTRKSDVAVRLLVELDRRKQLVKASALAGLVGTTAGHLPHVVAPLQRRGWVESEPGPQGGYRLSASLGEITVLDVIESVEGLPDPGRCVLRDGPCLPNGPCALHDAWRRAREALMQDLARTPVSQVSFEEEEGT